MADETATEPQAPVPAEPDQPAQAKPEAPKEETPEEPSAPSQESSEPTEAPTEPAGDEPSPEAPTEETPDETVEAEATPQEEPKTRKERREERKRYYDSIRSDNSNTVLTAPKEYLPRDYSEMVTDDGLLDTRAAEEDRKAYAEAEAQKTARSQQYKHQQDEFRKSVDVDKRIIESDPKFSFMKEGTDDFDYGKVEALNDRFMAVTGYREVPTVDEATGQTVSQWIVDNPNVSYEKFIRNEVAFWDKIAEEKSEEVASNTASEKATQGTRPTGTQRATDISDPSAIAKMSPAEFKKNEKRMQDYAASLPPK